MRGLRVQLILWTILPLTVMLILLSVVGITQHRQAMTDLVTERNRGLALAEAGRLAREVDSRGALLLRASQAAAVAVSPDRIEELAAEVSRSFPGGLAVLDRLGQPVHASSAAAAWSRDPAASIVAARAGATGQPQYEGLIRAEDDVRLLIGVPLGADRVLVGDLPVESLGLAESSSLVESGVGGAVLIIDATGRLVYRHNPGGLHIDERAIADLPTAPPTGSAMTTLRSPNHELSVTYALVAPPGWTLAIAENVHAVSAVGFSVVEALPLTLLAIALVALLAVSFGVTSVVRPLQELDRRAQRVAWGDFDAVNQPVGGVQEMDDLRATLAQMAERIRAYQAGMRDYLSAVTQAQEAERERLAHELHDDTVQALIALRQRTQSARKALGVDPARTADRLDELIGLIDEELANLRRLIGDLRPIYLEDLGFVPALQMLVKQVTLRHSLDVELHVGGEIVRLAPDLELAAFRIMQQAVANAAAHAQPHRVTMLVEFCTGEVRLSVTDDGRGFTPPDQPADLARNGHFGLMGMRERALLYGGQLTIESAPGRGTTVQARLPVG